MKKILSTAATIAMLFSTAVAGPQGTVYLKLTGGVNKGNKLNIKESSIGSIKSKTIGFAEIGIGYNALENVRIDLTFTHFFNPEYKIQVNDTSPTSKFNVSGKVKLDIDTLLINGYVNLFDAGIARFYVGAGAGVALIKNKINGTVIVTNLATGTVSYQYSKYSKVTTEKATCKFAYAATIGASAEITEGISLDFAYSYRGILLNSGANNNLKNNTLNSHIGSVGIRIDM